MKSFVFWDITMYSPLQVSQSCSKPLDDFQHPTMYYILGRTLQIQNLFSAEYDIRMVINGKL
jgi:hypothetical protein